MISRESWAALEPRPVVRPNQGPVQRQVSQYARRPFQPSLAAMAKSDPTVSTLVQARNALNLQANPPCRPEENTVVWITSIPPGVRVGHILATIRCGKVVAVHINPPTAGFSTAACKVQFFTRHGALRYLAQAQSAQGVLIAGQRVQVRENRNMRPPLRLTFQSRAVKITGPAPVMATGFLLQKFEQFFEFQLEAVQYGGQDGPGRVVQIWLFGSLRAQAESAVMLIERDPEMAEFEAQFTADPCAAGRWYD